VASAKQPDGQQAADDDHQAGNNDNVKDESARGGEASELSSATGPIGTLAHPTLLAEAG